MKELLLVYIMSMVYCWSSYNVIPLAVLKSSIENKLVDKDVYQKINIYHNISTIISIIPILNTIVAILMIFSSALYFFGIGKKINNGNICIYAIVDKNVFLKR